jgi:GT2 family glycosyltransferase
MVTKVSLIIPTYNRGEILADTIRMAAGQDYPDYEVIVVDQSPVVSDAARRAISDAGRPVRLIHLPRPNLPAARNAGVRAANGDIIVFVDDDVVIGSEFVTSHVRVYDKKTVGGATGLTFGPHEFDEETLCEKLLSLYNTKERYSDGTASVRWVAGCNCSFRRGAFIDAGMSDPRFTGYAEDADLSVRVEHLGYTLLFDPRIRLRHLALASGGCELRADGPAKERALEETCRMYLFFCLKNRMIRGGATTVRSVWSMYRHYSLNRSLIQSWGDLTNRQKLFFRSLIGAFRLIRAPRRD